MTIHDRSIRPLSLAWVGAAAVTGGLLGTGLAVIAVARRGKPLHPAGTVAAAVLTVTPAPRTSGSPLLDQAGTHQCLVRASYAVGTGPKHADIEGFALRVLPRDAGQRITDILFASTGTGRLGRYLLTIRPPGKHAGQTTLLPVLVGGLPLALRLRPLDPASQPWPTQYQLSWAHGRGPWHPFGMLAVAWNGRGDAPERFDPVVHPLTGTSQYPVVTLLREPAYRLARLARPSSGQLPYTRDRGS